MSSTRSIDASYACESLICIPSVLLVVDPAEHRNPLQPLGGRHRDAMLVTRSGSRSTRHPATEHPGCSVTQARRSYSPDDIQTRRGPLDERASDLVLLGRPSEPQSAM